VQPDALHVTCLERCWMAASCLEGRYRAAFCHMQVVVLNDIHIGIMDYINPATVADVRFRSMWAEFEWENKVRSCFELRPVR
jgi:Coatomer beta subunit appendage platform